MLVVPDVGETPADEELSLNRCLEFVEQGVLVEMTRDNVESTPRPSHVGRKIRFPTAQPSLDRSAANASSAAGTNGPSSCSSQAFPRINARLPWLRPAIEV